MIETTDSNGLMIVRRIDSLRKEKNVSRQDVATSAKCSLQSFTNWSARGTIPPADVALRIAKYLGVSVEWLITGHEAEEMSADERRLLSMYRELDVRDREDVLGIVEGKVDRAKNAESQAV